MTTVALSLWLPISRANFYGPNDSDWIESRPFDGTGRAEPHRWLWCRSTRLDDAHYRANPFIVVDVMRRILEVLPVSFGYAEDAAVQFRGDLDSHDWARRRPVEMEMYLNLIDESALADASRQRANAKARQAGISKITLVVNENGYYTFTASAGPGADALQIEEALRSHITEVFGGEYQVHPATATHSDFAGSEALLRYNGLRENRASNGRAEQPTSVERPLGMLSFYQLHVLAEGIWNDQLLPALYLEHYDTLVGGRTRKLDRGMAEVIDSITTDVDAMTTRGKIEVLHHFLAITTQTSLQKLTKSLESVRRQLLEETVGSMHRRSRLPQLNLSSNVEELAPEFALNATATQLKGYSTVLAAKVPLISGVEEVVRLAMENLEWLVGEGVRNGQWSEADAETIQFQLSRLRGQMLHWQALVKDLVQNVASLEHTIEHTRMDQILYEQQQARSDQEALAEIERGRLSRPDIVRPPSNAAYNMVMLLLTAAAGILTLTSTSFRELWQSGAGWLDVTLKLWPLWAMIAFAYGVVPVVRWGAMQVRQGYRAKRVKAKSYPYEFAFQIEQPVDLRKLDEYARDRSRRLRVVAGRSFFITNRGFGRVEVLFRDSRVLKVHSAAALALGWWRYAHFEIINEVLVQRIAAGERQMLAQCRVFGEAPRPLSTAEVEGVAATILDDIAVTVAPEYAQKVRDLLTGGLLGSMSAATGERNAATSAPDDGSAIGALQAVRQRSRPSVASAGNAGAR